MQGRAIFLCTISFVSAALGNVIHVPGDQPTIQAAINVAVNGDIVQVDPGTYVENIDFHGKAITVAGAQSDLTQQTTIIDGNLSGPVVTFASGEGPQSVLTGFTIRNGSAHVSPNYDGGGIRISNSSPTVRINIITGNQAAGNGGGIYSSFGSPRIEGNLVTNNGQMQGYSGGVGGGVFIGGQSAAQLIHNRIENNSEQQGEGGGVTLFAAGTPLLDGNVISGNSSTEGGGIWIVNNSDALLINNLVTGNNAPVGGGLYWTIPSGNRGPYLINNTFSQNSAAQGSALYLGGFQSQALVENNVLASSTASSALYCDGTYDPTPPAVSSNDVYSSVGSSYAYGGTCAGFNGVSGNISADPLFAGNGDYRLAPGSPAIDSGSPNQAPSTDLNGAPRPLDGNGDGVAAFDMGAFEAPTPTSTSLTSSANPASSGQSITFTASIAPSSASGNVQFYDGATSLGSASLNGGTASLSTILSSGMHSITAAYSGNASFSGSTSSPLNQSVRTATVTSLSSSRTQSFYGQTVVLSATVNPSPATGTVQFLDGATSLGMAALSAGSAQLTVSTLSVGNHAVAATYGGSATYDTSSSPVVNITVVKATPVMSIASAPNPAVYNQPATLTASIMPVSATGTVQFFDGGVPLGTATVTNGSAALTTTFSTAGIHSLTASYSGDANYVAVTASFSLGVAQAPTSTTIISSANPSARSKPVTFTATVSPSAATGSVNFFDGNTLLGTANLSSGRASLTTSSLSVGTHSITASYNGSTNFLNSSSAVLSQVVNKH